MLSGRAQFWRITTQRAEGRDREKQKGRGGNHGTLDGDDDQGNVQGQGGVEVWREKVQIQERKVVRSELERLRFCDQEYMATLETFSK
jgi:hypothetical protein